MRRIVIRTGIFVLLGVIVNIAVVWGCEAIRPGWQPWRQFTAKEAHAFCVRVIPETGTIPTELFEGYDEYGCGWHAPRAGDFANPDVAMGEYYLEERIAGWPLLSMRGWFCALPSSQVRSGSLWDTGLQTQIDGPPVLFPLRPIWAGFAANTAFCAAIIFFLFCGTSLLRRQLRRKRGRCIKCGYDLRGDYNAGCPECGWGRCTT